MKIIILADVAKIPLVEAFRKSKKILRFPPIQIFKNFKEGVLTLKIMKFNKLTDYDSKTTDLDQMK